LEIGTVRPTAVAVVTKHNNKIIDDCFGCDSLREKEFQSNGSSAVAAKSATYDAGQCDSVRELVVSKELYLKRATVVAALMIAACGAGGSKMPKTEVVVRGVSYAIPKDQIRAAALSPPKMAFVHLKPPGEEFHLILDAFSPYFQNKLGPDVPTISRLNSNMFGHFEKISTNSGLVICSKGPELHFNCGLQIEDRGVKWGVLFDRQNLKDAELIRRKAELLITSYRSDNG
jgi:hypothetical protein